MGSGGGGGGIGAALAAARGRSLPRLLRRLPRFSLGGVFLNSSNMRTTLDIPMTAAEEGRMVWLWCFNSFNITYFTREASELLLLPSLLNEATT